MSVLFAETSVDGVLPSFDKTYAYRLNEKEFTFKIQLKPFMKEDC